MNRQLGFFSLFSVAIGIIISQSGMLPLLQTAAYAQSGFVIPLGCAYVLGITYILSFAELALMFPRSGGLASYTEEALGNVPAIVAVFSAYVIPPMLGIAAELFLLDTVINQLYPGVFPGMLIGYGTLIAFAVLNYFGIDLFSRIQNTIVAVMVSCIALLAYSSLFAASGHAHPAASAGFNPMGLGVISLVALAIWCMIGTEYTAFLVEEAKNPRRALPRAMLLGLTVIFILYLCVGYGALKILTPRDILDSPTPHILFITTALGQASKALVAAIAVTATASCVNTVMASIPGMLRGMANNRQVFPQFKKLSKHNSPWVGILFMALVIGVPLGLMKSQPEAVTTLLTAAAVSWFLAYMLAHLDVLVLRWRAPQLPRPFKTPLFPIPQLIGLLGFGYIALHCSPSPPMAHRVYGIAGGLLLCVTLVAIAWVRWHMKERLFAPIFLRRAGNAETSG